jgi:hypothetical protein
MLTLVPMSMRGRDHSASVIAGKLYVVADAADQNVCVYMHFDADTEDIPCHWVGGIKQSITAWSLVYAPNMQALAVGCAAIVNVMMWLEAVCHAEGANPPRGPEARANERPRAVPGPPGFQCNLTC